MNEQSNCPPELRNVVLWLRHKSGLKTKTGVLNGRRMDYFKGKHALKILQSEAYTNYAVPPKGWIPKRAPPPLPLIRNEEEAKAVLSAIVPYAFFLRVDRGHHTSIPAPAGSNASSTKGPRTIEVNRMQQFEPDLFFVWLVEGSQLRTYIGGILLVGAILAGVMFPLWPSPLRLGVWYLSVGVLGLIGLFFVIAILRLIFYLITIVVAKPGIWIFPNLFEDVGFFESFVPLYEWDLPKKKGKKKKSKKENGTVKEKKGGKTDTKATAEAVPSATSSAVPPSATATSRKTTIEEVKE